MTSRKRGQEIALPTLPKAYQRGGARKDRIAQQLRREVSELMRREMNDPALAMAAITDVDLSPDLKHATLKVSVTGDSAVRHTVFRALRRAEGYLRMQLGQRLENLKTIPHLRFEPDLSIEYSIAMSKALDELHIPDETTQHTEENGSYDQTS
ncbi:MAG: 30S ribosome-binding factor RbfA [Candidatus Dormibacteria bacterium]